MFGVLLGVNFETAGAGERDPMDTTPAEESPKPKPKSAPPKEEPPKQPEKEVPEHKKKALEAKEKGMHRFCLADECAKALLSSQLLTSY